MSAVSNTLTSFLTLSDADTTYAPKANPTFTGNVTSSGVYNWVASNGNSWLGKLADISSSEWVDLQPMYGLFAL
jgi:hypothetical protein